jgi:hypothetical protein
MGRELKFRAYDKFTREMIVEGFHVFGEATLFNMIEIYLYEHPDPSRDHLERFNDVEVMQFTGHQIAGKDVYEGDIVRLEENADGIDPDDKMTWYVVTWLQEWCMFALLRAKDEYREYLAGGVEKLDTTIFWTFPLDLEDTDTSKHYLCGNIYEDAYLLEK